MAWLLQNSALILAMVHGPDNQLITSAQSYEPRSMLSERCLHLKAAFKMRLTVAITGPSES